MYIFQVLLYLAIKYVISQWQYAFNQRCSKANMLLLLLLCVCAFWQIQLVEHIWNKTNIKQRNKHTFI